MKYKTSKQLERHIKGVANHRRIDILFAIAQHNGLSLDEISEIIHCNFKTTSDHAKRLT